MLKLNGGRDRRPVPTFARRSPITGATADLSSLVVTGLAKVTDMKSRVGRLHAREAGFCSRQAAMSSLVDGQRVQPAAMTAYMELGNSIEAMVMDALYATKALLFIQYRLPDIGLNMGGYVDGLVVIDGKLHVLEVKSCGELPTAPKVEHWSQAMIYSAVTGLPAIVLYFSRHVAKFDGNLLLREFELDEDLDANRRMVMYRAAYAYEAVKAGVLPDVPTHLHKASDCGFCPFTGVCWDGVPNRIPLKPLTSTMHLELVARSKAYVDQFLDPVVMADRRIGVLHFLELHGNENAKALLTGTRWASLIT